MNLYVRLASMPLRIKLIIGLMAGALATISILFLAVVLYSQNGTPAIHTMVESITRDRLDTLDQIVSHTSSVAASLVNDPQELSRFNGLVSNPSDTTARTAVETVFQSLLSEEAAFSQVSIVGLDGKIITSVPTATNPDETQTGYYNYLKDHMPTSPSFDVYVGGVGDASDPAMDFVSVAVANGHAVAFIVIDVDTTSTSFQIATRPVNSTLGALTFYLINKDGTIGSSSRDKPAEPNAAMVASQAKLTSGNISTALDYTSPLSGRPVTGFALPIQQTGMTLVGELLTTPFGVSNESRQFLLPLLGLLFVSIVAISIASFFVISTVVSPIEYLLSIANEAVQGRVFDDRDPIRQRDELGKLYDAFIGITSRLRYDIRTLEDRILQRTHDIEATRDIGQALSTIREQNRLMTTVVSLIRDRFSEIDYVQIFLVDARRQFAALVVSMVDDGKVALVHNEGISLNREAPVVTAIQQMVPVVTLDTQAQPGTLLGEARSALALPLATGGTVIGVVDLQSKRIDAFTEANIRLYQTIADQLSIAINNAMLFEELQARLTEIEALNRQLIGEGWRQFNSIRRGNLLGASTATSDPNQWSDLQRRAIQTGEIIERVDEDIVTFALPVSLRGQVIGAVEWDISKDLYTEDTRQLARELSSRLAISADNARLFEQAQRIAQRERLVNEIGNKLTQQSNIAEILKVAVKEVGQALHVPQTSIRLATSPDETEQQNS